MGHTLWYLLVIGQSISVRVIHCPHMRDWSVDAYIFLQTP